MHTLVSLDERAAALYLAGRSSCPDGEPQQRRASVRPPGGVEGPLSSPGASGRRVQRPPGAAEAPVSDPARGPRERAAGVRAARVEINGKLSEWVEVKESQQGETTHFLDTEHHVSTRQKDQSIDQI